MDNDNRPSQPWSIPPSGGAGGQPPRHHNGNNNSKMLENQWVFRKCSHCNENFLPSDDPDFCSGECRISCTVLRRSGASPSN